MSDSRRSSVLALSVIVLLAVAGWAFRAELGRLIGGDVAAAERADGYPGAYPGQYLPAVMLLPTPSPVPPPWSLLHVGLRLRWDGSGYIFFDGYSWRPGTHLSRVVDNQVDGDTVRVAGELWYSPNPLNFAEDSWYCHYDTTTYLIEMCSGESDPAWKWAAPWVLPAGTSPANGERIRIDGQLFDVSGPHTFLTGYGEEATFWRMRNRDRFLYHADGGEWEQYVEAGHVTLFYEVDSGLLLYDNIKRTLYKNDESTSNFVQYESLISQNAGLLNVAAELRGPSPGGMVEGNAVSAEAVARLLAEVEIDAQQLAGGR